MVEVVMVPSSNGCGGGEARGRRRGSGAASRGQLLALVLAALRKSVIGWPTDVRHVAHVTFDRLQGFLGLPVEFELEIPGQVPSASASVFGVSPESMQCGYDDKGNSVPKILLLMQERLYAQDGLKNSQEEHVREQLNSGIVPDDIDVHCLASLIKSFTATQRRQCIELVKLLPPTQAALLHWVVELMADVVEEEESNKMNARNVAMVLHQNMTQVFPSCHRCRNPLTALMHAVQVMNLLKTLILKALREREDDDAGAYSSFSGSENYNCDGNDRPKDIDEATALGVGNERLIGNVLMNTTVGNLPPSKKEAGRLSSSESITEVSDTIGEEKGLTCNAADVTISELREMEIRIEMTSAEVRSATKGELILCS
ncbi:hypothetical protein BS78_02G080600 [Paspalum vaginatum]|nr:hypothetical protein BS78_02G080600 [Paspalum vaginatum]